MTVEDEVHLSVVRAGGSGTAIGESKYRKAGRNFELQWLDGCKWKKLGSAKEDGHGRVSIPFDVDGLAVLPPRRRRHQGHEGCDVARHALHQGTGEARPERPLRDRRRLQGPGRQGRRLRGQRRDGHRRAGHQAVPGRRVRGAWQLDRQRRSSTRTRSSSRRTAGRSACPRTRPGSCSRTTATAASSAPQLGYDIGAGLDGLIVDAARHLHRAVRQRRLQGQLPALRVDQDRQEPGQHRRRRRGSSSRSTSTTRTTASPASSATTRSRTP